MKWISKGYLYELLASLFLLAKGYRIVARNFVCRFGEIDIVASLGDVLIFVEVKFRSDGGKLGWGICPRKLDRIRLASYVFLKREGYTLSQKVSYDAILIRSVFRILHLKQIIQIRNGATINL